jgi:spore coat protein F
MEQTYSKKGVRPNHLAWHETLEIHELVAFQAIGLMKLKKTYPEIECQQLKKLYKEAVDGLSMNIRELIRFYNLAPKADRSFRNDETAFYAGDLLAFCKTSVRNYSIAITETATPAVRNTLKLHLNKAIDMHAKVFEYMHERSYYPAYDLDQMLKNDLNLAEKALAQPLK